MLCPDSAACLGRLSVHRQDKFSVRAWVSLRGGLDVAVVVAEYEQIRRQQQQQQQRRRRRRQQHWQRRW